MVGLPPRGTVRLRAELAVEPRGRFADALAPPRQQRLARVQEVSARVVARQDDSRDRAGEICPRGEAPNGCGSEAPVVLSHVAVAVSVKLDDPAARRGAVGG